MNYLLPLLWLAFYFSFHETPFLLKEQLTGIVVIQLKFHIFFLRLYSIVADDPF